MRRDGLPATFHGVDQDALQNCLANDPDSCLATVPGLAQCVDRELLK
ncbi:hypothetical protein ABT288_28530 [Streptomyces sp. NPDC001093]